MKECQDWVDLLNTLAALNSTNQALKQYNLILSNHAKHQHKSKFNSTNDSKLNKLSNTRNSSRYNNGNSNNNYRNKSSNKNGSNKDSIKGNNNKTNHINNSNKVNNINSNIATNLNKTLTTNLNKNISFDITTNLNTNTNTDTNSDTNTGINTNLNTNNNLNNTNNTTTTTFENDSIKITSILPTNLPPTTTPTTHNSNNTTTTTTISNITSTNNTLATTTNNTTQYDPAQNQHISTSLNKNEDEQSGGSNIDNIDGVSEDGGAIGGNDGEGVCGVKETVVAGNGSDVGGGRRRYEKAGPRMDKMNHSLPLVTYPLI